MGVRGIDISEHQSGADVERVVRENDIGFAFVRTNYGSNHDDLYFHQHCDAAERGGAIVLPYVYILAPDVRGSIGDCVRIIAGRYRSALVDWETGSGGGAELRRAHEFLWEEGFDTPLAYDPKWYWESVGSPDLSWMRGKVKGHWKSWYPDDTPRGFDAGLEKVPGYVWDDNRGGVPTRIVQFTGTGRLSGYGGNLDLNYFPGSREELAVLLGSSQPRARAKGEAMLIVNVDTGEYALLSGGVLTGVTPDNAKASRDKWGIPELGVNSGEWADMQTKSAAIEQAGVRADQTQALLREAISAVRQIPAGPGGVGVGASDVSRIAAASASATADLIDMRARDNDPTTGPAS